MATPSGGGVGGGGRSARSESRAGRDVEADGGVMAVIDGGGGGRDEGDAVRAPHGRPSKETTDCRRRPAVEAETWCWPAGVSYGGYFRPTGLRISKNQARKWNYVLKMEQHRDVRGIIAGPHAPHEQPGMTWTRDSRFAFPALRSLNVGSVGAPSLVSPAPPAHPPLAPYMCIFPAAPASTPALPLGECGCLTAHPLTCTRLPSGRPLPLPPPSSLPNSPVMTHTPAAASSAAAGCCHPPPQPVRRGSVWPI